jgi:hypothetical protein
MRRCVLGIRLPEHVRLSLKQLQDSRVSLIEGFHPCPIPSSLVLRRYDCVGDSDIELICKSMHAIHTPSAFEVRFVQVAFPFLLRFDRRSC